MEDFSVKSTDQPVQPLTRRELEILALLSNDLSNQEIADQLFLALSSVKWFVGQIYQKLGVDNRRSAVRRAKEVGLLEGDAPPVEVIPPVKPKHNLPIQLTSFIGREQEITAVCSLLAEHHLVTLTGSGGTGKTRLSLQAVHQILDNYPNGAWLVELAPLAEPALVPQGVALAIGLTETPGKPIDDSLVESLRQKHLLLILDNCEHLLEACAGLIARLLHACPGLTILATSREVLGVEGEIPYRVPPMSMPDANLHAPLEMLTEYDAVRLFVERARLASPVFSLTTDNAAAVAQVVNRLDGIPLAIELAASRLRLLSLEQVALRLNDAFRLLTGGSRTVLPHHQTLRASIDWSYNLLSEPERILLRRLSVFAGSWTIEAAELVCAHTLDACQPLCTDEILDLLSGLVDKSLILTSQGPGDEVRYSMLEMIRQYASERLVDSGENEALRSRHCAWCEQFVETGKLKLRTREWLVWIKKLDAERDNLRAALGWALDEGTKPLAGARIANHLTDYWQAQGHVDEGYRWLEKSLEAIVDHVPIPLALQARTLNSLVILLDWWAKPAVALQRLGMVLELCETLGVEVQWEHAEALTWLGWLEALNFGNLMKGLAMVKEGEALYRELGKAAEWDLTAVLSGETWIFLTLNKLDEAQTCAEEGWALSQDMDGITVGRSLTDLGDVASRRGEFSRARDYYHESLALFQKIEYAGWPATIYKKLGIVEKALSRYDQANYYFQQALKIYANSISLDNGSLQVLECMAINEIAWASKGQDRDHFLAGARLMGLDERLRKELGLPIFIETRQEYEHALVILQEQLDPDSLASAWTEGGEMTLEQAGESSGIRSAT
jgi:predicted ATPase/DNA-binding CsgD family transcriptional regulator